MQSQQDPNRKGFIVLRRFIFFLAFAAALSLTSCNGYSIGYLIQRARVRLSKPEIEEMPVLVFTATPFPTRLVRLATPTWEQGTVWADHPTPYPTSEMGRTIMLPVNSLRGKLPEEIGRDLFSAWLDYFKTDAASEATRVKDYRIDQVYLEQANQSCIEGTKIESITTVRFAVLLANVHKIRFAGGGQFETNGWHTKIYSIAVYRIGDQYTFSLLDEPPCALQNRLGTRVP